MKLPSLVLVVLLPASLAFVPAHILQRSFRPLAISTTATTSHHTLRMRYEDEDDEEDEVIDLGHQDWRAFRAKLVKGEPKEATVTATVVVAEDDECVPESGECDLDGIGSLFDVPQKLIRYQSSESHSFQAEGMTPLNPSQWAYDSGDTIEQGAVILGGVEQEFGFGLRQQYFHKAAMLVLDHEEHIFTKGIILNRPTDLALDDDLNPGVKWRVWFGGDVQGINSPNPDIVCLHHLGNPQVTEASIPVMNDIQWTTFENAKRLVHAGVANPEDFWVFVGYAGWGPGQLMGELARKSWYMVAADSRTLIKELGRQSSGADPRDAGLDTWTLLMNMIGRGETATECSGSFDDLMLKEWALSRLTSVNAGGGALRKDPVSRLLNRAQAAGPHEVSPGTLVRASGADRSPFLLEDQELHKSVVLIVSDDENVSVGAVLNRPAAKGLDIQVSPRDGSTSSKITLPLRFGGQYSVKGNEPLLWLHCSPVLRAANVGAPVGPRMNGIWKCAAEDVQTAISQGLAAPEEFFVVTGVTVWNKNEGGDGRGIQGEIQAGKFEVIPESKTQDVWDALSKHVVLTNANMLRNLMIADEAWCAGENGRANGPPYRNTMVSISGRQNYEEENTVFKSNVPLSELSDDALRTWVATFLLGAPALGGRLGP